MRLKKLILHGFKSFADRTEFRFDSQITGIVGPNGCGKSNVVDGFKWVLGEQSAKSLRGDAMMDVIFNGSGSRKPAALAEVVLVFDNPLRPDDTRLLNVPTDEVSVGRRLYRDGTSEYQINNATSRLKDVRELFLDTGVGVDAYSVIEQGRIAALLEANPEERRQIFEEAAGISKFKVKKKESIRKLEKVDQNLLRVTDIVEEVEKRLRSVKVQAGRARTFQEYSARLAELRLTYSLHEYRTLFTKLTDLDAQRDDAQFRLDDATMDLQRKQNELAEQREKLEALTQQRQQAEYELVQAKAAVHSAEQRQQFATQQIQQSDEQTAALEAERATSQQRLAETRDALAAEREDLARLTEELESHRATIEQRQQAFRDGQLRLNQLAADVERGKGAVLDLMRKLSQVGNRISAIGIEQKNIAAQQHRLGERRRTVNAEIEQVAAKKDEQKVQLDETLALIERQQQELATRRNEAASLGKQIAGLTEQLGAAREHRSGLLSRQQLLEDLEARREGVSEGVKAVLRERAEKFPFIRGLVADFIRVDVEHARVIEAALDGRDQWLVSPSATAALEHQAAIEELEGRVNILFVDELGRTTGIFPMSESMEGGDAIANAPIVAQSAEAETVYDWNQHSQKIRLAIDLVRVEPADRAIAQRILGKTVVVDTLDDAMALHRAGAAGWRYVTANGEVIEADGTLRAGPLTAAMGILSRRSELEAIEVQVRDVDSRIGALAEQLSADNAQAKAIEDEVNAIRTENYQSNTRKVELTSAIAMLGDKLNQLQRELPVLDAELQSLLEQSGRLVDEDRRLASERDRLDAEQTARQADIESMSTQQGELGEQIKGWSEQLTAARIALGQVQEKQLGSQQQVQRHVAAESELSQQIERVVNSAQAIEKKREGLERELASAQAAERQLHARQQQLAEQLTTMGERLSSLQEIVGTLGREVSEIRESHAEVEQALHQLQMGSSEMRVRLEMLVQQTQNELQLDLPARYAESIAPKVEPADEEISVGSAVEEASGEPIAEAELAAETEAVAEPDWDAVASEIKDLRDRIQRLGNVNLDALADLADLEQREQFLTAQVADLTTSKQQLQELIDTINRESSVRFEQTFNAVREHFQGMFRKLFGGGKADVFLETEIEDRNTDQQPIIGPDGQAVLPIMRKTVDPLDAGIEIIARPPGKQPATISQLSGGEKAMTCIALLMSIFKSKPSPFCILDEVDAPLDEANNQRFGLIIQEFLNTSQFIVITHHKRTMQIADVLYGVTMQEQGVSKRVAVKFDQVDHQGRIEEEATAEAAA